MKGSSTSEGKRATSEERGTATVELALLVPALVIVLGLLVAGGRLWFARTAVHEAAQTASRAASLARSSSAARSDGVRAGQESLATSGLRCSNQDIALDTGAFAVPVGVPATVSATVTCAVLFGDVLLPGMPGSIVLIGTGSSALDTYRSRR